MSFETILYQLQRIREEIAAKKKLPAGIEDRLQEQSEKMDVMEALIQKLEDWCQRRRRIIGLSRKQIRMIREDLLKRCHECGSHEVAYRGTDVVCEVCGTAWGKEAI